MRDADRLDMWLDRHPTFVAVTWLSALVLFGVPVQADMLSAFREQPQCVVGERKARVVVEEATHQEQAWGLPSGLLVAVVLAESGGRKLVAHGRGRGRRGVDAGEAQVHLADVDQHRRRLRQLLVLSTNLGEGARILDASRARCARLLPPRACRRSPFALYNGGSSGWWARVRRIWTNLMEAAQRGPGGVS